MVQTLIGSSVAVIRNLLGASRRRILPSSRRSLKHYSPRTRQDTSIWKSSTASIPRLLSLSMNTRSTTSERCVMAVRHYAGFHDNCSSTGTVNTCDAELHLAGDNVVADGAQLGGRDKANWRSRSPGARRGSQVSVCTLSFARPVPTANPKQLAVACESGDIQCDGRSLHVGLVLCGRAVPVACCLARRNSRPSPSTQCAAAEVTE